MQYSQALRTRPFVYKMKTKRKSYREREREREFKERKIEELENIRVMVGECEGYMCIYRVAEGMEG